MVHVWSFFADYPDANYPDPEKSRSAAAGGGGTPGRALRLQLDAPSVTPISEDRLRLDGYDTSPDVDYMKAHIEALVSEKQALLDHIAQLEALFER